MKRIAWIALVILALLSKAFAVAEPLPSVTVMVYLCGSDLEKWGGAASTDIAEMLEAEESDGVRVYVQTGGAARWKDSRISGNTVQRFSLHDGGLHLKQDLGKVNMADEKTLSDFITYCAKEAPAERYILILWDHGGGPVYGYGSDELFGGGSMSLVQIKQALDNANVRFDLIGFDACLMATLETGLMLSPYASYLIASENTEPGTGWAYTQWLSALSQNPDVETEILGQILVDSYIDSCSDNSAAQDATLSLIDLAKLKDSASDIMNLLALHAREMISAGSYAQLAQARRNAKAFGYSQHDLVDLIDLIERVNLPNDSQILNRVREAIPYSKTGKAAGQVCGLSVYFPFNNVEALSSMQSVYAALSDMKAFASLLSEFATLRVSGNTESSTSDSWWFNGDFSQQMNAYIVSNQLTVSEMQLMDKGEYYALCLPAEALEVIENVQMQLSIFDEDGQIVMGVDDVIAYDDDGDIIADFDGTWVALNGQIVPFYSEEYTEIGDSFRYSGCVPAEIDGEDREIVIIWDNDHPNGLVIGARPVFEDAQTVAHGLLPIEVGSVISPYCAYFAEESEESTYYYYGDEIHYDGTLTVSYETVEPADRCSFCYVLTDVYGNKYFSEDIYTQ
ncbi:MAG: clostripain-related cysteine peptidase [Eubacteriales bacterium]|nr:clostripain-related cysteine peptidase [Eubacteriales bacterium]